MSAENDLREKLMRALYDLDGDPELADEAVTALMPVIDECRPQIPDGWDITGLHRVYEDSKGCLIPSPAGDSWRASHRARMAEGYLASPRFPTIAEAAAWCDEQAAQHEAQVGGAR